MTVDQGRPGEPGQPDQPDQHGPSEPARHVAVPDRVRALKRRVPAPLKAAARRTVRGYGQRRPRPQQRGRGQADGDQ